MTELAKFLLIVLVVLTAYFAPLGSAAFQGSLEEALLMVQEYAREHVLLCLVPALFIAGAISCFVSQQSVIKYFGAKANKFLAYSVASVSGTILAVCSCTVLPLFAGIYQRGAGIGPATAFLYSGPAINVLAIILTARVLGFEIGIARAVCAIGFSVIIGLTMQLIFRKEEAAKLASPLAEADPAQEAPARPLWQNALFFLSMVAILVFANWTGSETVSFWNAIHSAKWYVTAVFAAGLAAMLVLWFKKDELSEWTGSTWFFAKQILPLLLIGVFVSGFLLGRPGHEGIIPSSWVARLVGGNSIGANFFASVSGALMYFATLTEVPILQGLMGSGMGKGPALALLLAGPALSLPSMLVIRGLMGTKKTAVYVSLVIGTSTIAGFFYGLLF